MTEVLGRLYLRMLELGFITLKQAAACGNKEWLHAELELLHNVPSLVEEANAKRHFYFWDVERHRYLSRLKGLEVDEANSRCEAYYEPIWREMKPLVEVWKSKCGDP